MIVIISLSFSNGCELTVDIGYLRCSSWILGSDGMHKRHRQLTHQLLGFPTVSARLHQVFRSNMCSICTNVQMKHMLPNKRNGKWVFRRLNSALVIRPVSWIPSSKDEGCSSVDKRPNAMHYISFQHSGVRVPRPVCFNWFTLLGKWCSSWVPILILGATCF